MPNSDLPFPPSVPKKPSGADRSRQRWCRWKALVRISWAACPGRSFDEFFAGVRRRWPVSTAGSEFEDTARRAWATQIEQDRIEHERFEQQRQAAPTPPSPPSRRLVVIRRMAGAPLDPDETIEAGQHPAPADQQHGSNNG